MEYRQLGSTGARVAPICVGTMNFGGPTPPGDAVAILHAALDAGINFIDTANVYQQGRSEEIVGEAIKTRRDEVVLATKVFNPMGDGPNAGGTSRIAVMREVDRSLRRLQTDWIDLYQLHRFDETTPPDETMAALDDLVRVGKVRYVGVSTFPAWRVAQMQERADRHGWPRFVTEQPPYNLLERTIEKDLIPVCEHYGMGLLPWSPLAAGVLSDRFVGGASPESRFTQTHDLTHPAWRPMQDAIDGLAKLAADAGTTLSRLALAWLRDQPAVVAPVIGPRAMAHLDDAIASLDVTVADDLAAAVDTVVAPGSSFWFATALDYQNATRDEPATS